MSPAQEKNTRNPVHGHVATLQCYLSCESYHVTTPHCCCQATALQTGELPSFGNKEQT